MVRSEAARPSVSSLSGVWGSGENDVWAVGSGGAIFHYNGLAWSFIDPPVSTDEPELFGVWGSGPNDVWAVGADREGGLILRYEAP
jgi:hypothetical protein